MSVAILHEVGFKELAADMRRVARRHQHPEPVWMMIARDYMNIAEITIRSEGRRGGGSWPRLEPQTIKRKLKAGRPYAMRWSDKLYNALTHEGDQNQHLVITPTGFEFGTIGIPYAGRQNAVRPLLKFTSGDSRRHGKMFLDYVLEPTKRRRTRGFA